MNVREFYRNPKQFLSVTLLTIVLAKLLLFFTWNTQYMNSQKIDFWHHMYTGLLLIGIATVISSRISLFLFTIGTGLFLDELVHLFHMIGFIHEVDYWSLTSVLFTVLGYLVVSFITFFLYKRAHSRR